MNQVEFGKRRRTVRLLPTEEQEAKMIQIWHDARWAWNWAVNINTQYLENGVHVMTFHELNKRFTILRDIMCPWIKDHKTPTTAIQAEFKYCSQVFDRVFKDKDDKAHQNPPKFRSRHKTLPTFSDRVDMLYFIDGYVQIGGVGKVKVRIKYSKKYPPIPEGREHRGKFGDPRIKKTVRGIWILSFVETYEKQVATSANVYKVGIDVGIITLVVISHDDSSKCIMRRNVNCDKDFIQLFNKIEFVQSKLNHCYATNGKNRNSRKYKKYAKIYKSSCAKVTNKIHDYIDWIVSQIFKLHPTQIVIEDLDIRKMIRQTSKKARKKNKNAPNVKAKNIARCNWGYLRQRLKEKCEEFGIELLMARKYYPSFKICSSCDAYNSNLRLQDRTYTCPRCGLIINRDENAAINLKNYALYHNNYTVVVPA